MIPSSSSRPAISSNSRYESPIRHDAHHSASSSSSMRTRNRRLVSTEQELVNASATSTPAGSRAVSPIPAKHPSRSVSRSGNTKDNLHRPVGGLLAPPGEGRGTTSPVVSGGGIFDSAWSSWGKLQGFANAVLGGAVEENIAESSGDRFQGRVRRRAVSTGSKTPLPDKWGPDTHLPKQSDGGIGTGSAVERKSALIAQKRARILEGRDEEVKTIDTNGNYKRRTSTEEQRPIITQDDDYALVYIHHVQKQDTLQGVVLKYNCKPEVFRKANRLWPNDSIQIRETVVLPVEACAVKGRPCDPPSSNSVGVDLLTPTPGDEDTPLSNVIIWPGTSSLNGTSAERLEDDENLWVHVRWVSIDSSPNSQPVEIARMARKTLGYFPPRRRKSMNTPSTTSTPRDSADFPRLSHSISQNSGEPVFSTSSTPARRTSNLGPRPSQSQSLSTIGSYFPPASSSTHPRKSSGGDADLSRWMRGPGGVGTLNVRKPGPGQDGLNSWAKKHIPGLAIDSLPSSSILGTTTARFGFNDDLTSISEGGSMATSSHNEAPPHGGAGQGLGFEGGLAAVESLFRRFALKAPGTPKNGSRIEHPDLIELMDGTGSDDGRGFELTPGRARSSTPVDLDGVLRGKTSAGTKGGKSD